MTHRAPFVRLGFVAVAALLGVALLLPSPPAQAATNDPEPTAAHPLRVLYMGDSLAVESRDYFDAVIEGSGVTAVDDSLVFGGTAICDWLDSLGSKLKSFRPDVAVVEFAGNSFTDCMQDPETGEPFRADALVDKYWKDANRAMEIFARHEVFVYWVNPPASCDRPVRPLTSVFLRITSRWERARYIDANDSVTRDGTCALFLPCLDGEPCTATDPSTGQQAAIVRAPDGLHFCPGAPSAVSGVTQLCDVWSSGAWRYANAVAAPIIHDYDLTPTAPLLAPPSSLPQLPGLGV
jgi:hypothetical protein